MTTPLDDINDGIEEPTKSIPPAKQTITLIKKSKDKKTGRWIETKKEYEIVASRVNRFRYDHPTDLAIIPEIQVLEDKYCQMKCSIGRWEGDTFQVLAVGHKHEVIVEYGEDGYSPVNKAAMLENCETGAIGRALAAFGYIGDEFASAEEIQSAIERADQPQQSAPKSAPKKQEAPAKKQASTAPATDSQKQAITQIKMKLKGAHPAALKDAQDTFKERYAPRTKPNQLTKDEASEYLQYLMALIDAAEGKIGDDNV